MTTCTLRTLLLRTPDRVSGCKRPQTQITIPNTLTSYRRERYRRENANHMRSSGLRDRVRVG